MTPTGIVLAGAAGCEAVTGIGLMVDPSLVVRPLPGDEPSGAGLPLSRVAGIALLGLGLACWPDRAAARAPLRALLAYDVVATIYLLHLAVEGTWAGPLPWQAVGAHAVLSVACAVPFVRPSSTERVGS